MHRVHHRIKRASAQGTNYIILQQKKQKIKCTKKKKKETTLIQKELKLTNNRTLLTFFFAKGFDFWFIFSLAIGLNTMQSKKITNKQRIDFLSLLCSHILLAFSKYSIFYSFCSLSVLFCVRPDSWLSSISFSLHWI